MHPLFWGASAFALALFLGAGVLKLLRRMEVVDLPNQRSSHQTPTPRGGGLAILCPILLWFLVAVMDPTHGRTALLLGLGLAGVAVISFVDDVKGVPASARFAIHLVGGLAVVGLWNASATLDRPSLLPQWSIWFAILFWVVGSTNAFNFMDGINGLATLQAIITSLGTALVAMLLGLPADHPIPVLGFVTACAAIGFLPYNFPNARMFLGDAGSASFGFLLSGLAVWTVAETGWRSVAPLLTLHMNFLLDTSITLIRRILRGERWFEAHREHFYQRLVRAGFSHTRVTCSEFALQTVVLVSLVCVLRPGFNLVGLHASLTLIAWLSLFLWIERSFPRATSAQSAQGS